MKKYTIATAVLMLFLFSFVSCKKKNNDPIILGFHYTGLPVTGQTLTFLCEDNAGRSYFWDFGDGTTSSLSAPEHIYTKPGTYVVSLTPNGNRSNVVNKEIKIVDPPLYTQNLAGKTRLWAHTMLTSVSGKDSMFYYTDTSFAISYIDPLTISVGGKTLTYYTSIVSDSFIVFSRSFPGAGHTSGTELRLTYYHAKDSISYLIDDNYTPGTRYLTTYTTK